jgi:biopolymer transport protein ExbB/TolQ
MLDVFTRFSEGGSFMWVILFIAGWALAIIIDRFVVVFFKANVSSHVVMEQIERFIGGGDTASAIKYCNSLENKPLVKVLRSAIVNIDDTLENISSAMDETMLEVLPNLQKRTGYLFTLANIATLIGLMGTIGGLITSFGALDVNDPSAQAHQLGHGISVAMLTTAFGLVVAVPCMLLHQVIQNKTEAIVEDIDHCSTRLINLLGKKTKTKK